MAYGDDLLSSYEIFQRPTGEGQARQPRLDRIGSGTSMGNFDLSSLLNDPMAYLALFGTGMGIGENIYSGLQADRHGRQLQNLTAQQFNPAPYIQQMTAEEQAAAERSMKGNLALSGVPSDSMASRGAIAELMAGLAGQRYQTGLGAAQAQRQMQLQALLAQQPHKGMGDVSALPQYLSMLRLQGVQNQAQQQQSSQYTQMLDWLKSLMGGSTPAANQTPSGQLYGDNYTPVPEGGIGGYNYDPAASESYAADPGATAQ